MAVLGPGVEGDVNPSIPGCLSFKVITMKDITFHIVRGYTRDTLVVYRDSDGNEYPIIHFNEDGSFTRISNIPIDSGFKLTMTNKFGVGQQLEEKEFKLSTGEGPQPCRAGLRDYGQRRSLPREAGLRANEQPELPDGEVPERLTATEIQDMCFTPPAPTLHPTPAPHPDRTQITAALHPDGTRITAEEAHTLPDNVRMTASEISRRFDERQWRRNNL